MVTTEKWQLHLWQDLDMVTLAVMDPNHAVKVKAALIRWGQQQLHQRYTKKDEKF